MTTLMRHLSVRAASPWLLAALLTVVLAACAVATAGESEEAAPTNTNPAPVDPEDTGRLYAQCMRDNGLPDFPDPNADGSFALGHGESDHDPNDPTLRAALEECRALAPAGADHQDFGNPEFVVQMFDFSQCMRKNGLPDFPDPDADGRLRGIGHEEQGPEFQAAMETCREQLPGGGDH